MKTCHGPLAGTGHGTGGIIEASLRTRLARGKMRMKVKQRNRRLKKILKSKEAV